MHDEPVSEYVFSTQGVQSAKSSDPDSEDVPAMQLVHFEPASEYMLIAQFAQSPTSVEPDSDDFLAAQLKHVLLEEAPEISEYFPSGHCMHVDPAGEYVPKPQFWQLAEASDPGGDDLPNRYCKIRPRPARDVHLLHLAQSVPMIDENSALRGNMPQRDDDDGGKNPRLSFSPASSVWGQTGCPWTSIFLRDRRHGETHGGRLCCFLPSVPRFHKQPRTGFSRECAMPLSAVSHGW